MSKYSADSWISLWNEDKNIKETTLEWNMVENASKKQKISL